ncbi:hypothetical protein [Nocardia blacklockiae]|uniref:hypothetical protein n=1 Tax=Nocardia blacklockiae TaxID=480036 RepID=UPI001894CCB9|nr:hypothetical protein [Nocardia blacklockiae]MBF6174093.1 hypothetical protein [Nocardia blacklockiae]
MNVSTKTGQTTTVSPLAAAYLALGVATVIALAVLSAVAPAQVTQQAWVRGVIVAITAILTYVFARRADSGDPRALLRLRIIVVILLVAFAAVLLFLPLPLWMVVEQALCLVLLAILALRLFRTK